MLPNADILEFLFATVATIVATVTGLIGAFSTFRLQNITEELTLLKGLIINKKLPNETSIHDFIKGDQYYLYEKIYDRDIEGVQQLEKIVIDNKLNLQSNELLMDIDNIRRNQLLHNQMKSLTIKGFIQSLIFVFISLVLLIFTNGILQTGSVLWLLLLIYLAAIAYIFSRFVQQIKQLMA